MFQKAEVLYLMFFVTRNVKLRFLGFWQVESEPRKPKSDKIQPKNDLLSFRSRFDARRELVWSVHWYFVIPDSKERHHDIISACDQPCNKFCGRNLLHGDRKLLHRTWCQCSTGNRHETNPNPTMICSTHTTQSEMIIFTPVTTSDVIIFVTM